MADLLHLPLNAELNAYSAKVFLISGGIKYEDAKKIANLQVKYIGTSMRDAAFKGKLDKLTRDYQSLFKM